ncbi:unnamed protein product [Candida verbasci]|uniref:Hikeshi-like domain-containing protein n=1 Tax=Candida verbasci TaxID=1227364 RepID=A0A9W4TTL0_9ASCO|nr:unnamed protein product [Candida verbasci]
MSIFGAICSGRPMILSQQVEPTKFVITIPNASNVNYITIFILPNSPFTDPNITALIYFQITNSNSEFKLLGGINPTKPSAIYKVNKSSKKDEDDGMNLDIDLNDDVVINIGISIEPTPQAEQLINDSKSQLVKVNKTGINSGVSDTASLANKIVGNAYNYLASFIDDSGKVPIKAFDNWWDKFKTKLQNNPNFLNEIQN